ncbi:MAG: cytochrome bc1 complex diheme cytochrome c subunit [Jiangellaceae bacterium]
MSAISARRRHPAAAVVVLLLALLVFGAIYAAFAPASSADVRTQSSTQVEEGRKLFAIGCASCHGLGAEGQVRADGTVVGPSLIGVGAAAVDFQVGTGRMPMAAPNVQSERKDPAYDDEQIEQLAAFVASLAPGPAIPDDEALDFSDGDVARGGELFRINCASCHNTTGQGGALTFGKEAPSLTGVEPRDMYTAMLTGPQSMPVFNDNTLDPEEKRDIMAFLQAVGEEPNPGGLGIGRGGPVPEGLWAWLIGIGGLIGVAVWIGTKAS